MAKESFIIKMVVIMMGSGKRIKCMAGESYIIKVDNWLTKEIGLMINFMDMEKFSTIIQLLCKVVSITLISIYLTIIGNIMKEC
jgi:hypothetical protein